MGDIKGSLLLDEGSEVTDDWVSQDNEEFELTNTDLQVMTCMGLTEDDVIIEDD